LVVVQKREPVQAPVLALVQILQPNKPLMLV
jgi:hypothetical protein